MCDRGGDRIAHSRAVTGSPVGNGGCRRGPAALHIRHQRATPAASLGGECGAPAGQARALQNAFTRSGGDAVNRDSIASAIAGHSLTSTGHDSAAGTVGKSLAATGEWEQQRSPQPTNQIDHGRGAAGDLPAGPAPTLVAVQELALRSKAAQRRRHTTARIKT